MATPLDGKVATSDPLQLRFFTRASRRSKGGQVQLRELYLRESVPGATHECCGRETGEGRDMDYLSSDSSFYLLPDKVALVEVRELCILRSATTYLSRRHSGTAHCDDAVTVASRRDHTGLSGKRASCSENWHRIADLFW